MPKYKFSDIAFNITEKRMPVPEDMETYIAPNNLETSTLSVPEFGYKVPLNGLKLVMHKGDVLFGRREPQLKHAAIAPHDGIFSAHGMIFHANPDVIDPDFFPFFIASDCFFDTAIRISVGSLSPTVNWKDLKNIEFTIPDMDVQKRYAKVLWAIIRAKRAYRDLINQTDELVKSQFIEMFGDPTSNPKQWQMKTLKTSCNVSTGNTPSRKVKEYYGTYLEWIKSDNISTDSLYLTQAAESLSEDGAKVGRVVPKGSILMTCIAGSLNTVGNVAITDREVAFNQQINALTPVDYEPLVLYYLLQLIKPKLHEAANKALKCILNKSTLESIEAYVPDSPLQKQFADIALQSDKSKFELKKALESLDAMQKAIVDGLFQCHM